MPHKRWILVTSLVGMGVVGLILWNTSRGIERESRMSETLAVKQIVQTGALPLRPPAEENSHTVEVNSPIKKSLSQQAVTHTAATLTSTTTPASPSIQIPATFLSSVKTEVSPEDQAIIADIANHFSEEIKQIHDPRSSPEYYRAWKVAADRADATLQQQLGTDLYNRLQSSATNSQ